MGDDKAVVGIVAFAQDLYYAQPVFGADIGAVQAIQLKAIHQAELANIGNKLQQLLRVQLRRQPIRGHFRGDGAAGTDQQGDQGRLHHLLQGLCVGGAGHSGQIGGAAGLNYGAVQQIHSLGGGQLAGGMGIENDGVAGGDHGNGVAGHGGQAVGNGR